MKKPVQRAALAVSAFMLAKGLVWVALLVLARVWAAS